MIVTYLLIRLFCYSFVVDYVVCDASISVSVIAHFVLSLGWKTYSLPQPSAFPSNHYRNPSARIYYFVCCFSCMPRHQILITGDVFLEATLRPSDRANDRAIARSTERSNDRTSDRAIERATERAIEGAIEGAIKRSSDRSSDRASSERSSGWAIERAIERNDRATVIERSSDRATERSKILITRAPNVHLTHSDLCVLQHFFKLLVLTHSQCSITTEKITHQQPKVSHNFLSPQNVQKQTSRLYVGIFTKPKSTCKSLSNSTEPTNLFGKSPI